MEKSKLPSKLHLSYDDFVRLTAPDSPMDDGRSTISIPLIVDEEHKSNATVSAELDGDRQIVQITLRF